MGEQLDVIYRDEVIFKFNTDDLIIYKLSEDKIYTVDEIAEKFQNHGNLILYDDKFYRLKENIGKRLKVFAEVDLSKYEDDIKAFIKSYGGKFSSYNKIGNALCECIKPYIADYYIKEQSEEEITSENFKEILKGLRGQYSSNAYYICLPKVEDLMIFDNRIRFKIYDYYYDAGHENYLTRFELVIYEKCYKQKFNGAPNALKILYHISLDSFDIMLDGVTCYNKLATIKNNPEVIKASEEILKYDIYKYDKLLKKMDLKPTEHNYLYNINIGLLDFDYLDRFFGEDMYDIGRFVLKFNSTLLNKNLDYFEKIEKLTNSEDTKPKSKSNDNDNDDEDDDLDEDLEYLFGDTAVYNPFDPKYKKRPSSRRPTREDPFEKKTKEESLLEKFNKFQEDCSISAHNIGSILNRLGEYNILSREAEESKESEVIEPAYKKELKEFIGMDSVKERLDKFYSYMKYAQQAKLSGIKLPEQSLHMVFTGNPGTGKTSMARVIAKILYDIGIINTDKCVEATRKDLVGEYIGHTAQKTDKIIKSALDGVLFIDEAYALNPDNEISSRDFGKEVISTLITAMEDYKNRLVVIFAGYKEEMKLFINSNPGIKSRIGYTFNFEDYTVDQLLEICKLKLKKTNLIVEPDCIDKIKILVEHFSSYENIGNGRFITNLCSLILQNKANLYLEHQDNITTITKECIPSIEEVDELLPDSSSNKKVIGF